MKIRPLYLWIYLGLIGALVFYLLRPTVEYPAIQDRFDPPAVIVHTKDLAKRLGMEADSLISQVTRHQHITFYEKLRQQFSGSSSVHNEAWLRHSAYPLTTWGGSLAYISDSTTVGDLDAAQGTRLSARYDHLGRVVLLRIAYPMQSGVRLQRDTTAAGFSHILDALGYNPENYVLKSPQTGDTGAVTPFFSSELEFEAIRPGDIPSSLVITTVPGRPEAPPIPGMPPARPAPLLESVTAHYQGVSIKQTADDGLKQSTVYMYSMAVLIVGFILVLTLRRVYRNQVDWSRGSKMFFIYSGLLLVWAALHLNGYSIGDVPSGIFWGAMLASAINTLLIAFLIALSYLAWDSLARQTGNSPQIDLVDAFWRRRFFIREAGEAVLLGYALAGILMAVLAILMYTTGGLITEAIYTSGIRETTTLYPVFSAMLHALYVGALLVFGPLGVVYYYSRIRIGHLWFAGLAAAVWVAISMTSIVRFIFTDLPLVPELFIFFVFGLVLAYFLNRQGIVTVSVAVFLVVFIVGILPMFSSGSTFYQSGLWVAGVVLLLPVIFGIAAYVQGHPVAREHRYVPPYQEASIKQQRFEREIEIARESQFALMPLSAPVLSHHDIKGFFIPSLEVGGDYHDYRVVKSGALAREKLFLTIFDVSGKAMKAAMQAVFTSGLIMSRLSTDAPEEILTAVNPVVKEKTDTRTFITCVLAEIDLESNVLRFANAGHCQPMLKRKGKVTLLESPHPKFPLGMFPQVTYTASETPLLSGDLLVLYSDGFPEAKNAKKEEYGFQRACQLIEAMDTDKMSSTEVCLAVKKELQSYSNYAMHDDTTVICLKVR